MKRFLPQAAVAASLLAVTLAAPATDLDLYVNMPTSNAALLPNVLFVIDNTANWSTAFEIEKAALQNTFDNLPADKFNIGIIFGTEEGGTNEGQKGGYVRAALRRMSATNKAAYSAMVSTLGENKDKASGGVAPLSIAEAYRYLSGANTFSGSTKTKADFTGNGTGNYAGVGTAQDKAVWALSGNALPSYSATRYNAPIALGSCAKNYVIFISNGPNQSNNQLDEDAVAELKAAAGGGTAGNLAAAEIPLTPSSSQDSPIDEWARFMKKSPLQITTYAIDVNPKTTGQGPGWTAVLKSMAGSNYKAVNSADGAAVITDAINNALSKIQSVNSVFAAVSLPASANVQGAFLNQLFVGMFRPDQGSLPRWNGNMKQYKLGEMQDLVDANGNGAINTGTGFVTECAVSFWTPTTTDTYWALDPKGKCLPPGSNDQLYAVSNKPDGNIVEKGAQAYMLRQMSPASRNVKTCAGASSACTALLPFNTTNVPANQMELSADDDHESLVNWAIGYNVMNELSKGTTVMRPSVHGDVVHSNPLALSYNNNADVVVYYGSNDGMLRAVNGNQTRKFGGTDAGAAPGRELWSFMPPEFFKHIKRLKDNDVLVKVTEPVTPATTTTAATSTTTTPPPPPLPKPFGIDGPIAAYREGTSTWIYSAMRRGGRAVYAFDVSNPLSPEIKWRSGCPPTGTTGCTEGLADIGQTWSIPRPIRARGYGRTTATTGTSPLIIMGGGYDECEDADGNTCTTSTTSGGTTTVTPNTKGNKVYILDGTTGAHVKTFTTDRAVVADIKFVPDGDGYAKYAYAVDLGGNIYRITILSRATADWSMTKIASLGCATTAPCANNRKFMMAPSVIPEPNGDISLYLGSGDREKPLGADYFPNNVGVGNYFFKVKDKPTSTTWLTEEKARCENNEVICLALLGSAGSVSSGVCGGTAPLDGKGWALGLRNNEQVVTPPATRFGVTTFSTHTPATSSGATCGSNLGTVYVYNLQIANAAAIPGTTCGDMVTGGGLPPPTEKMDVCWNPTCTIKKSICIGCHTDSAIQGELNEPPENMLGANGKRRVYWYIQK